MVAVRGLRFKLMAPFVLGMICMSLFLACYTYSEEYRATETAMLLISKEKTKATVTAIEKILKLATGVIQRHVVALRVLDLFEAKTTGSHDWEETMEWLERMVRTNDPLREILILDNTGLCIASSSPEKIGKFHDKPYVTEALQGKFNFGPSSVNVISRKFSTPVAGPIEINGEIIGALVILTELPNLIDYTPSSSDDISDFHTSILNSDGLFLVHPDKAISLSEQFLFPELYKRIAKKGKEGAKVSFSLNGKKYVGFACLEDFTNNVIITGSYENTIFSSAYYRGLVIFGITLFFSLVLSFIVTKFSNEILKVLLNLIDYAQMVSAGDLTTDLEKNTRDDELGVLQDSLAKLVEKLRTMLVETQETSKMKGEFLANMSHEIRTPLNAIIGLTYLVMKDGKMDKKQKTYMDKVQLSAKCLLRLINDILDISKFEAGMLELETLPFNLYELISDSVDIHEGTALGKRLTITTIYAPDAEVFFHGDELRIGQVINNLISNALKFTQEGGISVFCTQESEISADNKVMMKISVKDSGIGMSPKTTQDLFKPFIQADASISRRFGGTGLGLAISKNLVDLLGGSFEVQSCLGEGTTFSFTIPLTVNSNKSASITEQLPLDIAFSQLNLHGKTILIAEDNPINQEIMFELISPSGAKILLANDGQEAVDLVSQEHVDIIFMDLQMPFLDGFETTAIIRKNFPKESLPIIALTANVLIGEKEKALLNDLNGYITKPIEPIQIITILQEHFSQK